MMSSEPTRSMHKETDMIKAGIKLQEQGLSLLLAEMQALAALMPGAVHHCPTDSETEAGFDNMPV